MSLRRQLILVFISAVILPIVLIGGVTRVLFEYRINEIKETYGIESTDDLFSGITVGMVGNMTQSVEEEIENVLHDSPDRLENTEFLTRLNEELSERNSFILVRKGETLIFNGASEEAEVDAETLPEYGSGGEYTYLPDGRQMYKQIDFVTADKTDASIFIVTEVDETLPEIRFIVVELIIAVVLILILIILAISAWTYRVMIKPVRMLREATQKIRDGDLDFKIEVREQDEVGLLCQDFDEMRQRLKESAEMQVENETENKELIRNISHDLKTPITAIKGYAEAIQDGVADTPEKLDHYVQTICNKAEEMERLIDELSYYSKVDSNRIPYAFIRLNVKDYFSDCAEELSVELEAEGVTFEYTNSVEDNIETIADPEQLKKVINNIISNSVKYMDKPQKKIEMCVKEIGDSIQVSITDNGKGISQKDLPLIFERFYRSDSARSSSTGGSGVGLSIVKKIVEDHGGRIWASSVEGEGTTIFFELREYWQTEGNSEDE